MRPLRLLLLLLPLGLGGCVVAADVGPPVAYGRGYYGRPYAYVPPPPPRYYAPAPRYHGYGYGYGYGYGRPRYYR